MRRSRLWWGKVDIDSLLWVIDVCIYSKFCEYIVCIGCICGVPGEESAGDLGQDNTEKQTENNVGNSGSIYCFAGFAE